MIAALLLLSFTGATHRLDYVRADDSGCPERAVFERAVAERLGYEAFVPTGQRRVWLRLARDGSTRTAELKVFDERNQPSGARALQSTAPDCDELLQSAALAAAMAVDPLLLMRPAATPPPPPPSTPADGFLPPPPPPAREPAKVVAAAPAPAAPGPHDSFMVSLGPSASFNRVPTVMAGLDADLGWESHWWGVYARLSFVAPAALAVGGGRFEAMVFSAGPLACFGSTFGACVTTSVGALHSRAVDLPNGSSATTFTAAIGAQPYFNLWLADRWRVRFQLGAQLHPFSTVLTAGNREVWRSPVYSLYALVSIGFVPTRF